MAIKIIKKAAETAAPLQDNGHFLSTTPVLYSQAQQMHGMTSKGVLIPDELHESRLGRAAELIKGYASKGSSIFDVGCGYGALWPYIRAGGFQYHGIDPHKDFIAHAQKLYASDSPVPMFQVGDISSWDYPDLILFDYVVCLGLATHLKPGQEHLDWLASRLQMIAKKAVILEVQGIIYSGQFTKHGIDMVTHAFCQRPRPENFMTDPVDSAVTYFLRVA